MATEFDYRSFDGTLIRGWRNDAEGIPVVVSNGLGSPPEVWPILWDHDCGYRAVTYNHRGTLGSHRPADPYRIRVEHHVEDLVALMDHEGIDRALLVGWSIGVNVAFAFTDAYPDRVAGLLAVAGLPGGTFAAMGGPLRIPKRLRRPIALRVARTLKYAGPVLNPMSRLIPANRLTATIINHSGLLLPAARTDLLVPVLERYLRHDWGWYMRLAEAAAEHEPMDVGSLPVPVTLLAGQHDVLTSVHDMCAVAERLPDGESLVLPGTHFLSLEYPDDVTQALNALVKRTDLSPAA